MCLCGTANTNKGVTWLLLGAAVGVLGVLAVVIVHLCKLYGRPTKKTHQRWSSSMKSSIRQCDVDQYIAVSSNVGDVEGTVCIMVPVTPPPSGQQTKKSCSQLPVQWIRSESDRDPTMTSNGTLRSSMIVTDRGVCHSLLYGLLYSLLYVMDRTF